MTLVMLTFFYLQVLDLLTTIAFLLSGVEEGNPLARFAMQVAPNPIYGLLMVKIAAVALGAYCWLSARSRLMLRVNYFYAVIVAWNLGCLIIGLASRL